MASPQRRFPNLLAPAVAAQPAPRSPRVKPQVAEGARWEPQALAQAFRRASGSRFSASR